MNWYEFSFSGRPSFRALRHTVFWVLWSIFFVFTTYQGPLVTVLSFLLIHILACYVFLYFVLSPFLRKKNYILFITGLIGVCVVTIGAAYMVQGKRWSSISNGLLSAQKIIGIAAIIKLLKYWWLQQKEKERLEREKMDAELELLKASIHPTFLFNSLNNIYYFSLLASPRSPEMLLKLSDILSYMLYECNDPLTPLAKEITMLRNYMALEKIRFGDRLEMSIRVNGETEGPLVPPLLLLHFIENSFRHCDGMVEQAWVNLEINIVERVLYMKLFNGRATDAVAQGDDKGLEGVRKRLQLLCPDRHTLKIIEDPEILIVNLEMKLNFES